MKQWMLEVLNRHDQINAMNLLNWKEVSRILTGGEEGVRRNKIPHIHKDAISELVKFCESWIEKHKK